ncbi:hypothetical protein O181_028157 [Austropuccinia psidii MF-1]|uniref:Uncharacterized protein n=1 Tax=Austropuccinia psidii MF-1 TaxID=1389203 RepID=A0A9Q3H2B9_9BASI|nr:hypothetical protein [Austropuccinia psidii MF-1]
MASIQKNSNTGDSIAVSNADRHSQTSGPIVDYDGFCSFSESLLCEESKSWSQRMKSTSKASDENHTVKGGTKTVSESVRNSKKQEEDDEENHIDADVVRDIIIGLSDGLTVPFGLTAGLSSLGSSQLVVVAGMAELISGAISMGIGGYLASEAERDLFRARQKILRTRVAGSSSDELRGLVQEILGPFGVQNSICNDVAQDLLKAEELETHFRLSQLHQKQLQKGTLRKLLNFFSRKPKAYASLAKINDHEHVSLTVSEPKTEISGMTNFLLRFGEGKEEVPTLRLYISAFTIGTSYFLGGLIPMGPYFFVEKANVALLWSSFVMFLTLLVFGALKSYCTGAKSSPASLLKGSLSTVVVGGGAAAASYFIVKVLEAKK